MRTIITGGTLLTPGQQLPDHSLIIEKGRIFGWQAGEPDRSLTGRWIEAHGCWVVPGFLDLHIHGSGGFDVMDAVSAALHGMGHFLVRHGVTGYLATTMSAPPADLLRVIDTVARTPQPADGAHHLGVHLEGPFLNPEWKGAQPAMHLRPPDAVEHQAWLDSGVVRLITLAPEMPGALELIESGAVRGVSYALGHSHASHDLVLQAVDMGLRQVAHLFNAMPGLHHREPGPVGAALTDERLSVQIIADGIHLHPTLVNLTLAAKGSSGTILISDAMRAAGLGDGTYDLSGQPVTVRGGEARRADGLLAGSTLSLDQALRNTEKFTGRPLPEILPSATSVPAEAIGLSGKKGVLAPGADADVVLLDGGLRVQLTMIGGRVAYEREPG